MDINPSLYTLLQNRIIQAALPATYMEANYQQLFDATAQTVEAEGDIPSPLILCEISQCLCLVDRSEIRREDGTYPEELGYCEQ